MKKWKNSQRILTDLQILIRLFAVVSKDDFKQTLQDSWWVKLKCSTWQIKIIVMLYYDWHLIIANVIMGISHIQMKRLQTCSDY